MAGSFKRKSWDKDYLGNQIAQINSVTGVLHVDNRRVDMYVEDGSIGKPFKEIQSAIDAAVGKTRININPADDYAPITLKSDIVLVGKRNSVYIMATEEDAVTIPADCGSFWMYGIHAKVTGGAGNAALRVGANATYFHIHDSFFWTDTSDNFAVVMDGSKEGSLSDCDYGAPVRILNSDGISLRNVQQMIDAPGKAAFFAKNCTNLGIIGESGIGNVSVLPNSFGLELNACDGYVIAELVVMGVHKALYVHGNSIMIVDGCGFDSGVLDVDLEVGSTLKWGLNAYDPAKMAIAGTLTLIRRSRDLAFTAAVAGNWPVSAPTDAQAALDTLAENLTDAEIEVVFDGGGVAIAVDEYLDVVVPFDCEIQSCYILADQAGTITIDAWGDTYANFPPTNADSITAAATPTTAAANKYKDTTLTGWTTALTKGNTLRIAVEANDVITRATFALMVKRI